MMINYNHSLTYIQKFTALNHAWSVSIQNYKKALAISQCLCLCTGYKSVVLAFLGLLVNSLKSFLVVIYNYVGISVTKGTEAHNSKCRSKAVHIRIFMSHYKDFFGLLNQLSQGMSYYS